MKIQEMSNPRGGFLDKVLKTIDAQPYGSGLTKTELTKMFGCNSSTTADKWGRLNPEIRKRIVYIKIHDGRHKQAIYVAKKHRAKLIETGMVLERY